MSLFNFDGKPDKELADFSCQRIHHYTIGRSGSTLISQILRDLFGKENVEAGHDVLYSFPENPVIITYRDFRDVLVSSWRSQRNISFIDLEHGKKMAIGEIRVFITSLVGQIENGLNVTKNNNPHALLLKYEDFCDDRFDFIFKQLEQYFNFNITEEKKLQLINKYCFAANKQVSDKMGDWLKVEENSMIHGKHLYQGKIGCWKNFVPSHYQEYVNRVLGPSLKDWGYKI